MILRFYLLGLVEVLTAGGCPSHRVSNPRKQLTSYNLIVKDNCLITKMLDA